MKIKYADGVILTVFSLLFAFPSWAGPPERTSVSVHCESCGLQYAMEKGINLDLDKERLLENTLEQLRHSKGKGDFKKIDGFVESRKEAEDFARYIYRVWNQVGDIKVYCQAMDDGTYSVFLESEDPEKSYQQQRQVDEMVKTIAKQAEPLEGTAKIAFVHDWIMEHVTYRESYEQNSAYSALIEGKSACYGYARAFQAICNYAGIECESIEGMANDQLHMWNRVKVDGEWKYLDVTWNTMAKEKKWYLITETEMEKSHTKK